MKKTLFFLFALWLNSMAFAYEIEHEGLHYNVIATTDDTHKDVEVTYPEGYYYSGDIVIPSSFMKEGVQYTVTSIGNGTFWSCSELTSVTIPNTVTSIGDGSFWSCFKLTSITIPNSVTSIGGGAFAHSGLTSVTIPNSVTFIEGGIFAGCTGLTSVTIPNSVTEMQGEVFLGCSGLTSVTLSENMSYIGERTFEGCTSLITVVIPENVVNIYDAAFKNCSGLTSIIIPEDVTSIRDSVFYGCSGLTSVTIPEGVTSIGNCAFCGCFGLTSVTIPEGVTSIGHCAFQYCSGLTSIAIPESVTYIDYCAFYDCSGLTSVTIPEGVTYIGGSAFSDCSGLTSMQVDAENPVYDSRDNCNAIIHTESGALIFGCKNTVIPNSVTSIGNWAFQGCSGLTSVTIPESVTSFGSGAFEGCSGLTSITIPEGMTNIEDYAFQGCSGLTSVTIPEGVTSIGIYAFRNCSGLTSITIPEGVTSIGDDAFYGTPLYENVEDGIVYIGRMAYKYIGDMSTGTAIVIKEGTTAIAASAFINCSGLTSVTIPESVTSIGNCAFYACSGLTSVTIPESVTSIGTNAFDGCSGLTSVTIPESVTSIGNYAFYACSGLTSVTIPESVTSIGKCAFYACSGLTSVTIPESVTSIGTDAFANCSGLTSITIPNSVTHIDNWAFAGCSGLTSIQVDAENPVYDSRDNCNAIIHTESGELILGCKNTVIPNSVTSIGYGAFQGCSGLTSVAIPDGVTSIGNEAFRGCYNLTSIIIPDGVTSIGDYAFYLCSGLTSVTIPESVTYISEMAFYGTPLYEVEDGIVYIGRIAYKYIGDMSAETAIVIKEGTTAIAASAFINCSGLTSVTIPESVTSIGASAFEGCWGLTSITIPNSVTSIGEKAFAGCNQLTYVKMPFLPMTYPSTLFGKGGQYTRCYFDVPEGTAGDFIHYGYYSISDLSKIGWMRSVFADELDCINEFAAGLADGAAKDELNETLDLAAAKVDTMTSYVGIIGQIDAIKTAVKKFAGKVSLAKNTEVTAFIKNPCFNHEAIGWDVFHTGEVNAFVQDAEYVNGDVTINKFLELWTPNAHLEDCEMTQALTGLPAGHYRIEIDVLATTQDPSNPDVEGVSLVMNNQKIAISTADGKPEHVVLELEAPAKDVKLGLQVESSDVKRIAIDNFRLYYVDGMPPVPAASELVSSEDTVYLYNAEAGAFLNVGNSWGESGTQAILTRQGAPLKLTQNGEGAWEVFFYEGSRNQKKLYTTGDIVYADYNGYGSISWQFTPAPEGGYFIFNTEYDGRVLGKELDTHNDVIMLDSQEGYCRWIVLSKEDGDKLMAMHQLYNAIVRMRKSADLNEQLLANAESLYDQADAIYQDIKDMIVRLNSQLSMPKQGQPIDATYLIENPCFADNTPDGWLGATITSGVADNTQYETVEFYNDDFHMSQRIVGLPNGVYRLKYKGFHRPGYWENVMDEYFGSATDNASAIVYANAAEKTLKNICTGAVETPLGTDGNLNMPENVGELGSYGKSIPNNQKATRAYFDAGYYVDSIDVEVTDNQLTIGVRNTEEMTSYHWVILSDFELYVVENGKAAHNKLTIQDSKGISGGKTTLKIGMDNIDAIAGMQFDVQLPEGMTFSLDGSGRPKFTKSNRMNGMTVQSSIVGNNARVLVYALNDTVKDNSGNIINLEVNISNELANDDYEVKVINAVLTEPTALEIKPFDAVGTVTLVDAKIGDANKDGVVNVTDIISVANHILGDTSGSFDAFAADMNGDSVVNVTDIISIANLILGGGSADAKVRMTFELDPQ